MADISLFIAFAAGALSFLSPCVLPILPGFLGYLSGVSATGLRGAAEEHARQPRTRMEMFIHSFFFVLGFAVTFAIIGILLNGLLAPASPFLRLWLSRIGGLLIIFFGLFVLGVVRIPFLESEHRITARQTQFQHLTSLVFGATFAVGWSPCVGAVLASIFTLAALSPGGALPPILAYSAGLAIPFLLVGLLGTEALQILRRLRFLLPYYNLIAGLALIALGVLVATMQLTVVAGLLVPPPILPYLNGGGI